MQYVVQTYTPRTNATQHNTQHPPLDLCVSVSAPVRKESSSTGEPAASRCERRDEATRCAKAELLYCPGFLAATVRGGEEGACGLDIHVFTWQIQHTPIACRACAEHRQAEHEPAAAALGCGVCCGDCCRLSFFSSVMQSGEVRRSTSSSALSSSLDDSSSSCSAEPTTATTCCSFSSCTEPSCSSAMEAKSLSEPLSDMSVCVSGCAVGKVSRCSCFAAADGVDTRSFKPFSQNISRFYSLRAVS